MKVFLLLLFTAFGVLGCQSKKNEQPKPYGMIWIPGSAFTMGSNDQNSYEHERPAHKVSVDGFWMDVTEVTNEQYKKFVDATGYTTIAERKPAWEELQQQLPPGTPKPDDSLLVAGSLV